MRLRLICFFVCETYLSACSAVLSDEHTVRGGKRQPTTNPDDEVYGLSNPFDKVYAACPDEGECLASSKERETAPNPTDGPSTQRVCCPSTAPTCVTQSGQVLQSCEETPLSSSRKRLARRLPGLPGNTPVYDVLIYPSAPQPLY